MAQKFSKNDKNLITQILQRGLELLSSNDIADFYDLGTLVAHLALIAASSQSKTEDRHEHFTYGLTGDCRQPALVDKIQTGCDLLPRFEKYVPTKQKWMFAHLMEHRYENADAIPKFDLDSVFEGFPQTLEDEGRERARIFRQFNEQFKEKTPTELGQIASILLDVAYGDSAGKEADRIHLDFLEAIEGGPTPSIRVSS